ncbi:MAG: hypothetical protein IJ087_02455 [Eggerthellaceae bacterium]|nr:hypothetical protein [Eggerthellaceae bacterium]
MAMEMSLDYRLRWLDFDRYGRMRPESILDLFQDVATLQADDMGIGHGDMLKHGVFWAVVRMKYEVLREPVRFQVVTARTWPHTMKTFSFMRDFELRDESGDLLVKASSEWVLMDLETRRFTNVKSIYDGPTDFVADRSFDGKIRKVPDFEEDNYPPFEVVPAYSDIDLNGHVNNARYTNFVVDALNPGEEGSVKTLQIDYRHEALPGEPLVVHTRIEDDRALLKGVRSDGNSAFACAIEFA